MSLDDILTVTEIADTYGLNPRTVINACNSGRLIQGKECVYKGSLWIITRQGADRLWGYRRLQAPPGHRVCRICLAVLPESRFARFHVGNSEGLGHVCRDCRTLQKSVYDERRKKDRPVEAERQRQYRAAHRELTNETQRKSKLRRAMRRSGLAAE